MDHAVVEAALAALRGSQSRQLDRESALYAQRYIDARVEPQFTIGSADFAADPYLICADRYWNLRLSTEPTLRCAAECAGWLNDHVAEEFRGPIREKWALGYGFITRASVESAGEIADTTAEVITGHDSDCSRAFFATLYHAGKLRANLRFDELHQFLESSPLAYAAGPFRDGPLFIALRAFAAFGSHRITEGHARELLDRAWSAPERTRAAIDVALNGLAISVPFDGQGELLRDRATQALSRFPDDFMFHQRLANGQFLCGDHDAALASIDKALEELPAVGWRGSHELLSEQFANHRIAIVNGRIVARLTSDIEQLADEHRTQIVRHERVMTDLAGSVRRSMIRSVELVAVFAAIIAFAVGSLNVTLNGNLGLRDRIWLLITFGSSLLLFALLVVGGTWLITRNIAGPDNEP
ncbi:hypothetical protein ACWEKT_39060 [Nocardia takedensis]